MEKETKIKILKINGEKVMCQSPVLHEPSAAIVIPKRSVYQRQDNTWYIDFFTYARKDFFDFLDKRIDVSVEITDENGNTSKGLAIFTRTDSTLDEPIEYRMEGITALEPVKAQPIPEVPTFQMEDLHGKQVTLYYSSNTSTTGDYTVEQLFALENVGDSKVGIYVLSCNVKEGHK
ncbi:hypothetical protein ACTFOZ_04945 [Bacillus cereus group sp. MYBK71-2]|uniref:hypothetical protein n=1 Tax=Bacillus cereus group sp. MYBK71-2 TaxID=3450611 RepID=UPI003F7A3643